MKEYWVKERGTWHHLEIFDAGMGLIYKEDDMTVPQFNLKDRLYAAEEWREPTDQTSGLDAPDEILKDDYVVAASKKLVAEAKSVTITYTVGDVNVKYRFET